MPRPPPLRAQSSCTKHSHIRHSCFPGASTKNPFSCLRLCCAFPSHCDGANHDFKWITCCRLRAPTAHALSNESAVNPFRCRTFVGLEHWSQPKRQNA